MKYEWAPLHKELAMWREAALALPLWWRDDDAVKDTPALRQLLKLGDKLGTPVHLAVIPKPATAGLATLCTQHPTAVPMVHGWAHENHAAQGQKKAEFGHPRESAEQETTMALARMRDLFGRSLLPLFVPPWNRIDPTVTNVLASKGYTALSTYTPRSAAQVAGLVQINTHVDPISWKTGGGLVEADRLIAGLVTTLQDRRAGHTDATEPLGFLTHHLVHDAAVWDFTERCITELLDGGATPCDLRDIKDIT